MPLALHLARKAKTTVSPNPSARLYRSILKELPRVLTIYDIDIPISSAISAIRADFDRNADVKDERVKEMLVQKGYMDLEETLLQHKQRSHLLRNFYGMVEMDGTMRKRLGPAPTIDEQFARN